MFSWAFLGRRIDGQEIAGLILSYLSVALVFWRQTNAPQGEIGIGAGLIFASAISYAPYLMGSSRAIAAFGASRFTAYVMTAACWPV
ncbi:hypothetical protein [Methylococcus sp. EFPC2]|uniref:hypothetical protein n=1 Tax=Methylococcus sp. EFPC2 TaxID=2812648 RepID=UPI001967EDA9|nr:hypothetical protein [Methylococcus sp. EFPC2]QSA97673.1 hypothetical protein JWZ97_02210 [Methylococcus sp. EFPC2]